jgi:hypothetical protein
VFPLCEATIEHEPVLVKVTTLLVIEQLPVAVNETVRPEELVAETVSGPGIVLLVMAAKVIVWRVLVMEKVFVPFAASYVAVDGDVARIVQVPSATAVTTPAL